MNLYRADRIRRWRRVGFCILLCLAVYSFAVAETDSSSAPKKSAQPSAASAKKHHSAHTTAKHASAHTATSKSKSHGKKTARKRGQQAIDSTRAREIQEALIREHYLQGQPSGAWDATTQAAMQRFQADQGWQSKQIPDSRALIKLGLGPSHDHLLNPESAMTTPTPTPATSGASDPKADTKQTSAADNIPQQ